MAQGGDFVKGDGTGSTHIFSHTEFFPDENFTLKHAGAGYLSMANTGPDTNGCQFFITCAKAEFLDGKHVVFGRLLGDDSLLTLRKIENVPVGANSRPRLDVVIAQCGQL